MAVERKNFAGLTTPPPPYDTETEFINCNFTQPQPVGPAPWRGVRLWPGDDTPRTFTDCNTTNCELPPGSTSTGGLRIIKQYRQNSDIDRVTVDAVDHDVQRKRHRLRGRREPDGVYVDLPAPVDEDATPPQQSPVLDDD
jgi:hypothetical protein